MTSLQRKKAYGVLSEFIFLLWGIFLLVSVQPILVAGQHLMIVIGNCSPFRLIVDKIDTDHSGEITYEELRDWVKRVHDYSITRDTSTEFRELGGSDGVLTWEAFSRNAHLKESEHFDQYSFHYPTVVTFFISMTRLVLRVVF